MAPMASTSEQNTEGQFSPGAFPASIRKREWGLIHTG